MFRKIKNDSIFKHEDRFWKLGYQNHFWSSHLYQMFMWNLYDRNSCCIYHNSGSTWRYHEFPCHFLVKVFFFLFLISIHNKRPVECITCLSVYQLSCHFLWYTNLCNKWSGNPVYQCTSVYSVTLSHLWNLESWHFRQQSYRFRCNKTIILFNLN